MSSNIRRFNDANIKGQNKELVRSNAEETLTCCLRRKDGIKLRQSAVSVVKCFKASAAINMTGI